MPSETAAGALRVLPFVAPLAFLGSPSCLAVYANGPRGPTGKIAAIQKDKEIPIDDHINEACFRS